MTNLLIGAIAAAIVGLSKTAVPGGALLAIPLFAIVFEGRLIPGGTLPVLLVGDVFAVMWYKQHTRWDVLRPLTIWVGAGFVLGIAFFVAIGSATTPLELTIGGIVLAIVCVQLWRMYRGKPAKPATKATTAFYGTTGGFTTFVANAAGPVINTYLVSQQLPKHEHVGTSAWFYFTINIAKIPCYLALGALTAGGVFFTLESLAFDAAIAPFVVGGAVAGRALFPHIPQRAFLQIVLVFSAAGALKLLI